MTSEIRPGIRRLLRLVTRRTMQRDADEEIRIHLELRTKQLIGEGMSPADARVERNGASARWRMNAADRARPPSDRSDVCAGATQRRCFAPTFATPFGRSGATPASPRSRSRSWRSASARARRCSAS